MRSLDNIEKSGFRPGEYVGYFDGAWRIVRVSGIWRAIHVNGKYWSVEAPTLAELSPLLRTAQEVVRMKIGIGHELVIVARQPASDDIYFTTQRTWSPDPLVARLFIRPAVAYAELKHAKLKGYRVSVEGIFCKAFGHE